jgi:hypothetical protein
VLLAPFAGLALFVVPWLVRDRRVRFGLSMAGLLFFPLLWLPGRLFSAYCYVPFLGLALALAMVPLERRRVQAAVAVLLAAWIPWNYGVMRRERRGKLARDAQSRAWVTTLGRFAADSPRIGDFVVSGAPAGFQRWGVEGAIRYFYPGVNPRIRWMGEKGALRLLAGDRFALLNWDGAALEILSRTPEQPDAAYLAMNSRTPVWQLGDGWYDLEGAYRWIAPEAEATLHRPAGARRFELRVNVGPEQLQTYGPPRVAVTVGGVRLPARVFDKTGWQVHRWDLPENGEGAVEVRFDARPGFRPGHETRDLGVAVGGFGFVAEEP